jgi:hypothetical protein
MNMTMPESVRTLIFYACCSKVICEAFDGEINGIMYYEWNLKQD